MQQLKLVIDSRQRRSILKKEVRKELEGKVEAVYQATLQALQ